MLQVGRILGVFVLVIAVGTAIGVGGGDLAMLTYHSSVWELAVTVAGVQWVIFFYGAKIGGLSFELAEPFESWADYRVLVHFGLWRGGQVAYIASVTFVINSLMHRALWLGCLVGVAAAIVSMFLVDESLDAGDVFPDHHP